MPVVPVAGVPLRTPVAGFKDTPLGNVPFVTLNVGAGEPVAVTVNDPATPSLKVALLALVKAGGTMARTVRVKLWLAFGDTPLLAVRVKG